MLRFFQDHYSRRSGEQTAGNPSQDLGTFQGKLLRINADGSIPADNPFVEQTHGKYRAIWALGLRNPFTFAIRPSDGEVLINDVGGDKVEEVNRGLAGANYGWPYTEGPTDDPRFQTPIHSYPRASVCGAAFAPADSAWPEDLRGKYFFADYIHGWIKTLDADRPERVEMFATGLRNPVDLRFDADGALYVLLRNAWIRDDKFQRGAGSLLRITMHARLNGRCHCGASERAGFSAEGAAWTKCLPGRRRIRFRGAVREASGNGGPCDGPAKTTGAANAVLAECGLDAGRCRCIICLGGGSS